MKELPQRRALKTRGAIVEAFNRIFLDPRRRRIGVADVVAEARIGRSTFYDHFGGAGQVQLAALAAPFAMLANAAAGKGEQAATERLLLHFWENRARARATLTGRAGEQALRLLASQVEARLEGELRLPAELAAQQLAAAALLPLRSWLLGEAPAAAATLADTLCRSGIALAAALRAD
jgi:AcrR family transcriptional regulator